MSQEMSLTSSRVNLVALALTAAAFVAAGCGGVAPDTVLPSDESPTQPSFKTLGSLSDADRDGIPDLFDSAPDNPDVDDDGVLDGFDSGADDSMLPYDPSDVFADTDGDGVLDILDTAPLDPDADDDGIFDGFETDSDGDGITDMLDHYPILADANCNGVLDGEDPNYDNVVDYPDQIRGGEIVCGSTLP
jgi:hypothetical protein